MNTTNQPIVFVAGATGAIGYKLCLILKQHNYNVFGSTRSENRANFLDAIGVQPVIVDVFNENQLINKIKTISPQYIIHQLTDLPYGLNPTLMSEARVRNAKLREIGTQNLIKAAQTVSCEKFIAQSIAFAHEPHLTHINEDTALAVNSDNEILRKNAESIANMELQIENSGLKSVILRYGKLYGAATGCEPIGHGRIHVDAAAYAAFLAINAGEGIFQIIENDGVYSCKKAQEILGFDSSYRWKF
ncbi:NAD-dependent epimerase/dehydratase family protein [Acinetobacter piscicola]|uniref:NAD-dependent epimerase/dehydratase family protein n=1 Tax=Acinetobacter piscicola TaxID=2006115 RepID=UPI000B7C61A4|nr:NAD(P)-dependent oxidoreductase [Acinetobacter piscicola]